MKLKKSLFLKHDFDSPRARDALESFCFYLEKQPASLSSLELTPYSIAKILFDSLEDEALTKLVMNSLSKREPKVLKVFYTYEDVRSGEEEDVDEEIIYLASEGRFDTNLITGEKDEDFLSHVSISYKLDSRVFFE